MFHLKGWIDVEMKVKIANSDWKCGRLRGLLYISSVVNGFEMISRLSLHKGLAKNVI